MLKFIFLSIGMLMSAQTQGQSDALSKKQQKLIESNTVDFPTGTNVSFALIRNGEISFYGVKRTADGIQYSENQTDIFEIGSITKVFTSALLAEMVLQNKLELNQPIQSYLDFPINNDSITLLQLANHTSGLPKLPSNLDLETAKPSNPYEGYNVDSLKNYLTHNLKTNTLPGTNYYYSNVGAGILGYILEKETGLTFEELLQKYIADKYELNNTSTDTTGLVGTKVIGLNSEGKPTDHWDLNALESAGEIKSSAADLSSFALAQFNPENKALALTQKTTFEIPKYSMEVGLAWKIIVPDNTMKWHMHNGGTGGFSSIIALDLEQKNGVIILSNVSAFNPDSRNIEQLCQKLMQTLYSN